MWAAVLKAAERSSRIETEESAYYE
uniref:Uncharacterized protein n=1 Tax=Anguilla anguilla TaxID=7936 RepID=A0A0E9QSA5_ANGAN